MKYFIDLNSSKPAYVQLYDAIRADIVSGKLAVGEKLPSKRLMAGELGISLITVEHAYALLIDEGYAVSRQRSGYYVSFGDALACGSAAPRAKEALPELHSDFPFSVLAKTMRRVLSEYDRDILKRSPNSGCMELRRSIADYLERSRGIMARPEQIIIGSGAEYLYGLVVQLLGRECVFALENPCYEKIRRVYETNGARCIMLRLENDGIASGELSACHAGALHVTPYNSFPSGVTASAAKRYEYAQWAKSSNAYIIEDDYDSEFSSALKQISTIFSIEPEHVIYINTFSRSIAPGMRMGYMLLPEALLERYEKELSFYSCTVPVYEQYVLAEFIDSGEFERHINRARRKLRSEK